MRLSEVPKIAQWEVASDRAGVLAGQLAQLNKDLVDLVAEILETDAWNGEGFRSPEHWLMVLCAVSPSRARDLVAVARRRGQFPLLEEKMAAGTVSFDQMTVVARHVPVSHADSVALFVEAATVPQLRRALSKRVYEGPVPDPGSESDTDRSAEEHPVAPLADQCSSLHMGVVDGRFRLTFEADPLEGALVEQAVREAKDALFNTGNTDATLADGLVEVASRSLGAVESGSRRDHYKVFIHLEADGTGWINKKGALPQHLLRRFTCDGKLRPVWLKKGSPVSVGRAMRIVPDRTRRLVEDRDGGCRFPGCPVTMFLENHHLQHWRDGGATDIDSVVSLCPKHHSQHHQGLFGIDGNPSRPDGLVFRSRYGWVYRPRIPDPVPPPDHRPPDPQPMRGWVMGYSIDFPPDLPEVRPAV
ncbi:HNH endonuclease [Tessaracoccus bendigoensis DSM 12906]|uniref:HNH endonuclease n=1 Tax=Tessaracoccus bendigoensis DSM 12906 TaxID=1123357 RepID=A0A1M6I7N2_9ACTN|nr:HNH endonuclease signature motif containing protein [Tessaracoccus bendigoensis]SHJ30408.1 HNH endonuclease [Tessaracoccus bendigoensis DSM 12906]